VDRWMTDRVHVAYCPAPPCLSVVAWHTHACSWVGAQVI